MRATFGLACTAVALLLAAGSVLGQGSRVPATTAAALPSPGFHHLHLNATNPDTAIDFYTQQFPSTRKATFAGLPAVQTGNVYILFTRVSTAPPTQPQSAFWHFGWHVVSSHQNADAYRKRPSLTLLPLFTSDEGQTVTINTDSWPGMLTKSQTAAAKAKGIQPNPVGGWAYLRGPDEAIVEYQGDFPKERFNHVHMWQDDPYCAEMWYDAHLGAAESASWPRRAAPRPASPDTCRVPRGEPTWPSLARRGTIRVPPGGVAFDDVELNWYPRQGDAPLAGSRGQLMDHVALSVTDLDAWLAKLRQENVRILEAPYALGNTRAFLIEGPGREAIELVEKK